MGKKADQCITNLKVIRNIRGNGKYSLTFPKLFVKRGGKKRRYIFVEALGIYFFSSWCGCELRYYGGRFVQLFNMLQIPTQCIRKFKWLLIMLKWWNELNSDVAVSRPHSICSFPIPPYHCYSLYPLSSLLFLWHSVKSCNLLVTILSCAPVLFTSPFLCSYHSISSLPSYILLLPHTPHHNLLILSTFLPNFLSGPLYPFSS